MTMKKPHIVIIGGGFGGTVTAKYLKKFSKAGKIDVTIINPGLYFLFTPLLHEVAVGELSPDSVLESIEKIFCNSKIKLIKDRAINIDPVKKVVSMCNGNISYDYLVVSSGSETNYYSIPGARENTLTLKDLNDAVRIKNRLKDTVKTCAVIGAGATGVELVAEIADYRKNVGSERAVEVSLVAASPDVLPQFPVELRTIAHAHLLKKNIKIMTNECVIEVRPNKIIFADKSFLEAETIIWVAGVKPSPMDIPGAEKEKIGRIKIDEYLKVIGFGNIFSLGDISGTAPMLAQVAVQQGKIVAKNIIASISNKPLFPFIFKEKGLLVSLGKWYATGKISGIVMRGPFMWLLWRSIYLFNFHSWRKRLEIAWEWTLKL